MQELSLAITGIDGDDLVADQTMDNVPDGVIDAEMRRKEKQTLVLLSQKLGYDDDNFDSNVAAKLRVAANFALPDVYKKYNPMKMEWRKLVQTKKSHDANDIFKRCLRGVMKGEGFPCPRGEWEKKLNEMDEKPLQGYYTAERKANQAWRRKRALAPAANSPGSTDVVYVAHTNRDAAGLTGGVERLNASGSKRRRISNHASDHFLNPPDNVFTLQDRIPFQTPFITENNGVVTNLNRSNEGTPMATDFSSVEHTGMNYMPARPFPATFGSSMYISADITSGPVSDFYLGGSGGPYGISQQGLIPFMSGPSTQPPHVQYLPLTQPLAYPLNPPWMSELDPFVSSLPTLANIPSNTGLDGPVQHRENSIEAQAPNWNTNDSTNGAIPVNTTNQHNAPPTTKGSELSDTSLTLFRSAFRDCRSKLEPYSSQSESCEAIEKFFLRLFSDKAIAEFVDRINKQELEKREMVLLITNSEQLADISSEAP